MNKEINIQVNLKKRVFEAGNSQSSRALLLLHGYAQTGQEFYEIVKKYLPHDWKIVAPNGLFLNPQKDKMTQSFLEKYAWYFYSLGEDKFYTPYEPAVQYLKQVIQQLDLRKVCLLGYSQGAYLAPLVAQEISEIRDVICVNGSYREKYMPKDFDFNVSAVHGSDDLLVEHEKSFQSFTAWVGDSEKGKYYSVQGAGHRWDEAIGAQVKALINKI